MTELFDKVVKQLDSSAFNNKEPWKLNSKRCTFILYYADWCGYCQNFKPEWIKFADKCQFIKIYAVNVDKCKNLLERMAKGPVKIKSFPTVWIYKNGKPLEEYTGERTLEALQKKAKQVCNLRCNCDK